MTESARLSYGARRWTAMSPGKSGGQDRSDIDTIGSGSAPASWSSDADATRTTDARTRATSAASRVIVEGPAMSSAASWFDRCRRQARVDQLDPPAVDDP